MRIVVIVGENGQVSWLDGVSGPARVDARDVRQGVAEGGFNEGVGVDVSAAGWGSWGEYVDGLEAMKSL